MGTYVIGDVQGCFQSLQALLAEFRHDPTRDRLVFVGDLVNRGPRNLEVLRWLVAQGAGVEAVLGNHDLHLLGRAWGLYPEKRRDTLNDCLLAPDLDVLIEWLRRRPLLLDLGSHLVLHAGLLPGLGVDEALELAAEISAELAGAGAFEPLRAVRRPMLSWEGAGSDPALRRQVALQGFTLLRTCLPDGTPDPEFAGPLYELPTGRAPWFSFAPERLAGRTVLFGHWAALGPHRAPGAHCLDSGCVWGRALTALRVEDGVVFSVAAREVPRG